MNAASYDVANWMAAMEPEIRQIMLFNWNLGSKVMGWPVRIQGTDKHALRHVTVYEWGNMVRSTWEEPLRIPTCFSNITHIRMMSHGDLVLLDPDFIEGSLDAFSLRQEVRDLGKYQA